MSTYADYVAMTIPTAAGTGVATLGVALASPDRAFVTAFGAVSTTVDVEYSDSAGVPLGCEINAVYNGGTPGTLTRGTPQTPGTLISLPAAARVRVVLTAHGINRYESAGLSTVAASVTTADVTGVVGTLHYLDLSGLTAARNFTLPAVAAVDDRVGVYVSAGCTTAGRELILRAATGDTLNGVTAAEWSRLFITGECVIMRCVVANTTWVVDYSGLLPSSAVIYKDSTTSVGSGGSATKINVNVVDTNIGSIADAANSRVLIRRAGQYQVTGRASADGTVIVASQTRANKNSAFMRLQAGDILAGNQAAPLVANVSLAVADVIELAYYHASGASRTYYGAIGDPSATAIEVKELL